VLGFDVRQLSSAQAQLGFIGSQLWSRAVATLIRPQKKKMDTSRTEAQNKKLITL
jgi:hypothetical protein